MFHVEQSREWVEVLQAGAKELGISLREAQVQAFGLYRRELAIWNRKINLTAIRTDREVLVKHFLDSLAYSKVLRPVHSGSSLLDVGSGAGFPGVPLKIFLPELRVILLEPNLKKTAFLWHVIGCLGLGQIEVISRRIEDLAKDPDHHQAYDWVTARALKAEKIFTLIFQVLKLRGKLLLGRAAELDFNPVPYGFRLIQEESFQLPFGLGRRVLSVLEVSPNL